MFGDLILENVKKIKNVTYSLAFLKNIANRSLHNLGKFCNNLGKFFN